MRNVFFIIILLVSVNIHAQDIIVKSDGDEVQAKVISVEKDKVSYKKWSNQNGPIYTIGTDEIFMVKYENGEKDVFGGNRNQKNTSTISVSKDNIIVGYVKKEPDANNAALINKHNPKVKFNLKPKKGKSDYLFAVMEMENTSVLSNEDIEMNIVRKAAPTKYGLFALRYYVEIHNKTDLVIYVDKANSFRTVNDVATPFYDTKQISTTSGGGSGLSVGLGSVAGALGIGGVLGQIAGGVSVGGGVSSGVSTTYTQQRILAIPPHSSAYMSEHRWTSDQSEQMSEAEDFSVHYAGEPVKEGHFVEFNADNSPYKYKYFITYSTVSDFKSYSTVNANLYAKYIVGCGGLTIVSMWKRLEMRDMYDDPEHMNNLYNKVISNFETDNSMLVGVTCRQ